MDFVRDGHLEILGPANEKGSVVHRNVHETDALGYRVARGDFLHRSRWLRCRRGDQLGFHLQERFFRQELKERYSG
jgi:hypothetical protein